MTDTAATAQTASPSADHGATRLADYQPFPFWLDSCHLAITLDPQATRVRAVLRFRPRAVGQDLRLDGEALRLIALRLDGQDLDISPDPRGLTLPAALLPDGPFTLETEVEIAPAANTALEGLYMSGGMYCTQCEAEGFRKITYYPDRPDVMTTFRLRLEGAAPVLLSNGNLVDAGPGWAEWHDPWPKPAYLFALVAGDLAAHRDHFTTCEGRAVDLAIWVRPADLDRCAFAMQALKRAMAWDERRYGRAYDLDQFNIVAVDDFNMGAMENKGLNIFNAKWVLASAETATDADYERIEGIIAHEYFHNWTGNRITCRDWFQLCLKEGLTVYRDQQFTAEMRSGPVKRIEDVLLLRARQFREDMGPLAHPVRPDQYVEINNFYTATVYEKGAELIGMLRLLVGDAAYDAALDLYFRRHDGQACTIEDWLAVFADVTGRDLTQFQRWYDQAGTPRLTVQDDFKNGVYRLHFTQETPPTPGQDNKQPLVIPIAYGLLDETGRDLVGTQVFEMNKAAQTLEITGLSARPTASVLRGFSAPVVLDWPRSSATRAFLLAHDSDAFTRWEAGRSLAREALARLISTGTPPDPAWLAALAALACDDALEPGLRALCLRLPSEDDMAQALQDAGLVPDPQAIHQGRQDLARALAESLAPLVPGLLAGLATPGPYRPEAADAGKRALRLALMGLMARVEGPAAAAALFETADNMTEQLAALALLVEAGAAGPALAAFYDRWQGNRQVIDKWFQVQIQYAPPETMVETAKALTAHRDFDWRNPNRFRAVMGALSGHHAGFHRADGAGYDLLADWLIRLDAVNPQTTARMTTAFETWPRYDADRQALARAALMRIAARPGLSRDSGEMVARLLGAGAQN